MMNRIVVLAIVVTAACTEPDEIASDVQSVQIQDSPGNFEDEIITPVEPNVAYTDGALYRQNFETMSVGSNWFQISPWYWPNQLLVQSYTSNGINGRILRSKYYPSSEGSDRINNDFPLDQTVTSATLSYDLKFHSDFDWVNTGKLHGLVGGSGDAEGCAAPDPDAFSVRVIWDVVKDPSCPTSDPCIPVPALYIYDYDRPASPTEPDRFCGRHIKADVSHRFQPGVWYRVDLYVKMNTVTTNPGNGEARLYIDGVQVAQMTNLRYVLDLATKIDSFRFTTFFGGNSSDYAPDEPEYAYFDNFTVRSGLQITGQNGYGQQCEIWEEGIFNPSSDVCCAESCGACGGTGCSSLPGGSSSCCTGTIQSSGNWCNLTGVSAPCFFL